MQISLPQKQKQERSSSVRMLDQQIPKSVGTSSRRNISSRSEYKRKNLSTFTIDTIGACCSGHGIRFKNHLNNSKNNLSTLDQISTLGLKTNHHKKQSKNKNSIIKVSKNKICNISTNTSNINKNKSKLELYTQNAINMSVNKIKKQINNKKATKKAKSTKKVIKQNITSKNSTSKKNSRKESTTKKIQQITKMTQINPFIVQNDNIKRKSRVTSCKRTQSDKDLDYGRTSYLKRQKTPQNIIIQEVHQQVTYPSQQNIQIKQKRNHNTSNYIHSTNYNSSNIYQQNIDKQTQMLNLLKQELTHKKQQQKYQQCTITQLKQNNIKLQQELFDSYRKYQNVLETQNDQIRTIQTKKDEEICKIKLQTHQTQCKLSSIQELCEKLRKQKQILIEKYKNQFAVQEKERNIEKEQLLRKIYVIQQKYNTLQNFNIMLEKQNKQLKQSTVKATTQRQKYEKAMKKYQNQINQLQGKLEVQIKKTKQQEKQIENLRKQKILIKQNSEIVLEIVRNQLKQKINQKKEIQEEVFLNAKQKENQLREKDFKSTISSWGSSSKKYENMQNMSPKKRILQENNY